MSGDQNVLSGSREQFLQKLESSGLLAAAELRLKLGALTDIGASDGPALAGQLVRDGTLTAYQARALLEGRQAELRIGPYEVLDLLGKGAMGTVFKVRHQRLKRLAALKVLAPDIAGQDAFAQRFQREVETLAQLSHPNIVMAYDAGESAAGPFLAMEFVHGRDLASVVKEAGPLSLADAVHCTLQAARGLEYAHAQGLVHRDIKPANLLRNVGGLVKVADLGLARVVHWRVTEVQSGLTQAGSLLGTVDYMAPEQALDSTTIDHRADIYSLGCTLYFLLAGRPVFAGSSLMALLWHHRDVPPPSLRDARPDAPEPLNTIFQRMVEKQPADRPATMTEVARALEEVGQAVGPPSLPAPAGPGVAASYSSTVFPGPRQLTDHGRPAPATQAGRPLTSAPGASAPGLPSAPAAPVPESIVAFPPESRLMSPAAARSSVLPATRRSHRRVLLAIAALAGLVAVAGLTVVVLIVVALLWRQSPRGEPSTGGPGTVQPEPLEPAPAAAPAAAIILNGGGSTFVNPLMQHWAGIYEQGHGVRVHYQAVGSGRGADGVLSRVYQFGASDAPLTDGRLAPVRQAGDDILHIPLVLGAVVPAYNLPGVRGPVRFTGPILADIFLGKIVNWSDPALRIANPGLELPNVGITVVHRADASGTTFIWTEYLGKVSGEWKARVGADTIVKWPVGEEGKGNNGVANVVSRTVGALGYLELTYALENNLQFGQVKNRDGKFVTPSLESVTAAAGALTTLPADLRYSLTDGPGDDTYPIVGTAYALVHVDQTGNPSGRDLVAFLRWATHEGQAYVKDLRYAPLPPEFVQRIDQSLATVRLAGQ
jgi:phosphate ABC transporter phosphate-binding protein